QKIPGPGANAGVEALARRIAEAQVDLRRVRRARHQLLSRAQNDPDYDSRKNHRRKVATIRYLSKPDAPGLPILAEALLKSLAETPKGPEKLAIILSEEGRQLLA